MLRILQKRISQNLVAHCTRTVATGKASQEEIPVQEEELSGVKRLPERGINKVTLVGRVGRDPEHRGSTEHPAVVFPLATNQTYKKASGELTTKTDWHRICVFLPGLKNVVANRIHTGDRLLVEGSITYQKYTDASQRDVNITSILANNIIILSKRQNRGQSEEEIEEK